METSGQVIKRVMTLIWLLRSLITLMWRYEHTACPSMTSPFNLILFELDFLPHIVEYRFVSKSGWSWPSKIPERLRSSLYAQNAKCRSLNIYNSQYSPENLRRHTHTQKKIKIKKQRRLKKKVRCEKRGIIAPCVALMKGIFQCLLYVNRTLRVWISHAVSGDPNPSRWNGMFFFVFVIIVRAVSGLIVLARW